MIISQSCENYRFSVKIIAFQRLSFILNRKIHGCLEIPDLFLMLNMISHFFAALTREISLYFINYAKYFNTDN